MNEKRRRRIGAAREARPQRRRQLVPAPELAEDFANDPTYDYEQFRADLDAFIDPRPKDWYEWAASTDRHVDLDRLREI